MNRRRYLAVAGVPLFAGVAGCLDAVGDQRPEGDGEDVDGGTGDGTGTDASPETETRGASDFAHDIRIVLHNSASDGVTVLLTVTTDETAFFEEEVGVPRDDGRTVDPGIDETGRYELEVAVEGGPDGSYPFGVGRYDLEQGSNLIVVIAEDDVSIMIEE